MSRKPVDPDRVELTYSDSELIVVETYPESAAVDDVAELYSELLGETAQATVDQDDRGRPVVRATADSSDHEAAVVAAHVAIGLVDRALDREAIETVAGEPRGFQ